VHKDRVKLLNHLHELVKSPDEEQPGTLKVRRARIGDLLDRDRAARKAEPFKQYLSLAVEPSQELAQRGPSLLESGAAHVMRRGLRVQRFELRLGGAAEKVRQPRQNKNDPTPARFADVLSLDIALDGLEEIRRPLKEG